MSRAFALARRTLEALGAQGKSKKKGGTKQELDRVLGGLQGRDAPQASELVYGVVRRRRTIHAVLNGVARRALKGRTDEVTAALELGAYALLYQEGEHARRAIDDAVALIGGGRKPREHVERVLAATRDVLEEAPVPWPELDPSSGRALPVRRGLGRRFTKDVLEVGGTTSPARRLAILHSYPDELVAAWVAAHGDRAEDLCWAGNDPPPLFARACSLRTSVQALVARLAAEGVEAVPRPDLGPHVLELRAGRGAFREAPSFREGLFTVQDATAQEPPRLLAPRPGEHVLDLCAAPGGKATYLAELAGDQAKILATDVAPRRLAKVAQTVARLGISSVETLRADARKAGALGGRTFDAVLVDAPCSNTGVLRRRPEARWRYDARSQRKLVALERQCLETGLRALAPGGRLVYSVCSIEPEEGPALVREVLEGTGRAIVEEWPRLPSPSGGDGGYAALVR